MFKLTCFSFMTIAILKKKHIPFRFIVLNCFAVKTVLCEPSFNFRLLLPWLLARCFPPALDFGKNILMSSASSFFILLSSASFLLSLVQLVCKTNIFHPSIASSNLQDLVKCSAKLLDTPKLFIAFVTFLKPLLPGNTLKKDRKMLFTLSNPS